MRRDMEREAARLLAQARFLETLISGDALTDAERAWLIAIDLGDALVDDKKLAHNNTEATDPADALRRQRDQAGSK